MKIKDTYHGILAEACRLMLDKAGKPYWNELSHPENENVTDYAVWLKKYPEFHSFGKFTVGYTSALLCVGNYLHYTPKDPVQYYNVANFIKRIEEFNTPFLLYLLESKREAEAIAKDKVTSPVPSAAMAQRRMDLLCRFNAITASVEEQLATQKDPKYLYGGAYTIADFALVGLYLSCLVQPIGPEMETRVKPHKLLSAYINHHREVFLPHLIVGGRYSICEASGVHADLYRTMLNVKHIRCNLVESSDFRLTIAGLVFTEFDAALQMVARAIGLLHDELFFDSLYYRDVGARLLFPSSPLTKTSAEADLGLFNTYYTYLWSLRKPNERWPVDIVDVYAAIAVEHCCKQKELQEMIQSKYPDLYKFYHEFSMRHKRLDYCVILLNDTDQKPAAQDEQIVTEHYQLLRLEILDVMKNIGFKNIEIICPLLRNYKEIMLALSKRKEYQEGRMEIYTCFDGNEVFDDLLGASGLKFLEDNKIHTTGASYEFDCITVDKSLSKRHFVQDGVSTSPHVYITKWDGNVVRELEKVPYPVLIKEVDSYASLGMPKDSKCFNLAELQKVVESRLARYPGRGVIVEHFIQGREFTVLVSGLSPDQVRVFPAVERIFHPSLPEGDRWLSFENYWYSPISMMNYKHIDDQALANALSELARQAYVSVKGMFIGRVDIRQEASTGKLYVLEVNANPGWAFDSCAYYVVTENGMMIEDMFEDIFYYGRKAAPSQF